MNKKYCPLLMSSFVVLVMICFIFLLLQYKDYTLNQKYNEQLDRYEEEQTTYQESLDENDQAAAVPVEPVKENITVDVFDIIKYNKVVMVSTIIAIIITVMLFIATVSFCKKDRLT